MVSKLDSVVVVCWFVIMVNLGWCVIYSLVIFLVFLLVVKVKIVKCFGLWVIIFKVFKLIELVVFNMMSCFILFINLMFMCSKV